MKNHKNSKTPHQTAKESDSRSGEDSTRHVWEVGRTTYTCKDMAVVQCPNRVSRMDSAGSSEQARDDTSSAPVPRNVIVYRPSNEEKPQC